MYETTTTTTTTATTTTTILENHKTHRMKHVGILQETYRKYTPYANDEKTHIFAWGLGFFRFWDRFWDRRQANLTANLASHLYRSPSACSGRQQAAQQLQWCGDQRLPSSWKNSLVPWAGDSLARHRHKKQRTEHEWPTAPRSTSRTNA